MDIDSSSYLLSKEVCEDMTSKLEQAKILLENHTCVLVCKEEVKTSDLSGIKPWLVWIEEDKESLKECSVADRCIGKAAAMLMVYAEVKEVYTYLISDPALAVFKQYQIPVTYEKKVENIINRTKTGICPMEELCLTIEEPETAYFKLKEKVGM